MNAPHFSHPAADLFVPDGTPAAAALARTTHRYAKALARKNDSSAVPFMLSTGDVSGVLDFQLGLRDTTDALVVAASDAIKALPLPVEDGTT